MKQPLRPPLPDGPYLVVGLARSGVAAALALRAAAPGARIAACDAGRPEEALENREGLERADVEVHLESDGTELLDAPEPPRSVVKSPGVPSQAPVVAAARDRGIDVVGELELGWRLLANDFCAVTGTNGKTTTTELIGAAYRAAGLPVAVAGNVGTPVCALPGTIDARATVACEASSFQLEDSVRFAPEVAVFLNLAEDHLDRHASTEQYLHAKLEIFANQTPEQVAVLNAGAPALERAQLGRARQVWFGEQERCELRLAYDTLIWRDEPLLDAGEVRLRGRHNLDNAMAAAAAALVRGVDPGAVRSALREFTGIEHRLEQVAELDGVAWVNDSKATNVTAATAALRAFDGGVHAILGGSMKGGGFERLAPVVAERCRSCLLIGAAAERLAHDLAGAGSDLVRCGDLERAVAEALRRARPGETVLLAPACASFDQYADFEQRGEHFRRLVLELAAKR
jgi:UDP-N-acetylmuramoylalanine--D-glutamate ligase